MTQMPLFQTNKLRFFTPTVTNPLMDKIQSVLDDHELMQKGASSAPVSVPTSPKSRSTLESESDERPIELKDKSTIKEATSALLHFFLSVFTKNDICFEVPTLIATKEKSAKTSKMG